VAGVEVSPSKFGSSEGAKMSVAQVKKKSPIVSELRNNAPGFETYPMIYCANSTAAKAAASVITGDGTSVRKLCGSAFRMIAAVASRL
jgi:hypothetical protein